MSATIPKIKVCGITNLVDAIDSAELGADMIGVVISDLSPRKGTRVLVENLSQMDFTVVGVYTDIASVERESSEEAFVQLHFRHSAKDIEFVKKELGKKVISVVFPDEKGNFVEESKVKLECGADLVLADFRTDVWIKESLHLPELSSKKIGLAGKISSENVGKALRANPYFIDLSSSLEEFPGKKSRGKILKFMEAIRTEAAIVR